MSEKKSDLNENSEFLGSNSFILTHSNDNPSLVPIETVTLSISGSAIDMSAISFNNLLFASIIISLFILSILPILL